MNKKTLRIRACVILSLLIIMLIAELLYSNFTMTVNSYTVRSGKLKGSIRLVLLSDLHGREFGEGNARLLEKIAGEEPDIIALAGDLFDRESDEEDIGRVCAFIAEAGKIAPVYFGMGNHEMGISKMAWAELAERIEQAGAVVLEAEYVDTEINGTPLRIGGYAGYYRTPQMDTSDAARQEKLMRFFDDFEDTDRFKLLINHVPTNWLDWGYRDKAPVDLVLSGHYHGGVVRIPILEQGLYAPYVGYFPPYTKGCFEGRTATCVLTTGLAGAKGLPRFFNPPEIVTVELDAG